jgi:hypothetical protein
MFHVCSGNRGWGVDFWPFRTLLAPDPPNQAIKSHRPYTYCFAHPTTHLRVRPAPIPDHPGRLVIVTPTRVPLTFRLRTAGTSFSRTPPVTFFLGPIPHGGIYFLEVRIPPRYLPRGRWTARPISGWVSRKASIAPFTFPYSRSYKVLLPPTNRTLHRHAYC